MALRWSHAAPRVYTWFTPDSHRFGGSTPPLAPDHHSHPHSHPHPHPHPTPPHQPSHPSPAAPNERRAESRARRFPGPGRRFRYAGRALAGKGLKEAGPAGAMLRKAEQS
jgi:hypothetical protein